MLLEAGADVNAAHTDGRTSLWMASQEGHSEVVKLLLKTGADVSVEARGLAALTIARSKGHAEIIELLVETIWCHGIND